MGKRHGIAATLYQVKSFFFALDISSPTDQQFPSANIEQTVAFLYWQSIFLEAFAKQNTSKLSALLAVLTKCHQSI